MPEPDGGSPGPDRTWSVPGLGLSFLARRARSSWLLLACVAVTVLLAAGLAAAGWTFAAAVIPPGAQGILAAPQGRVIGLSGVVDGAGQAATDACQIRASLRKAWPGIGYRWKARCGRTRSRSRRPGPSGPSRARFRDFRPRSTGRSSRGAGRDQRPDDADHRVMARPAASRQAAPGGAAGSRGQHRLRVTPGSVLRPATRSGPAAAGLRVTGLFRLKNPASPYWALDLVPSLRLRRSYRPRRRRHHHPRRRRPGFPPSPTAPRW